MSTLDKISQLLVERKRTQKELTNYLGLNKSTFTQWKSGKSQSYMKHLPKIAEFFGVSVDYLLGSESDLESTAKFALWGTTDVDDEVWEDVKHYAKIAQLMREEGQK